MKKERNKKTTQRARRHARIRAKVSGTADMPRLSVYRSNKFIYAQLVDDATGATLAAASDVSVKTGKETKMERARKVGLELAKAAKDKKLSKAVFDRGGFLYAGRIKALADAAREGGLAF